MRLLLFLVSFIFSSIFYAFFNLAHGKNIFGNGFSKLSLDDYKLSLDSISGNLLIESIIFLLIGIIFVFYFTPLNTNKTLSVNKTSFFYFIFYSFLLTPIYFGLFNLDFLVLLFLIIFIFGDILFSYISNLKFFSEKKLKLKYIGLITNYLISLASVFYIFVIDISYYLLLITIFSIFFNISVHKNYTNYPSLFISILLIFLIIYYLFLKLYDLYILFL